MRLRGSRADEVGRAPGHTARLTSRPIRSRFTHAETKIMKTLTITCLCLSVMACSTPYQKMGLLGGVQATQITDDTFQITARGNGYTDPDTIQRYVLRKAAEQTLASGFDVFVIGSETDRSGHGTVGTAYGGGGGGSAFAFGSSWSVIKPGETVLVKMVKGPKPVPTPLGVYDAREVLRYLIPATSPHPRG